MIESAKVRLVRCPKCKHILPEPPNISVFRCGGCGTVLQGKKKRIPEADNLLETSNGERVERVSLKSENPLENESENLNNLSDISDADVKSNASSLNFDTRGSDAEKSQDHSKDRADKWVAENAVNVNTDTDEPYSIKMEKETEEFMSKVGNASTSQQSGRGFDGRFVERNEVEGFQRNTRMDVGGLRYSSSNHSDEGPSNYVYGEPLRDGISSDGGSRNEYPGHNRARLQRQVDELKDHFSRSCDVTDKPKEKVPLDRRMFGEEAYGGSDPWFPNDSSRPIRSLMPFFIPDKRVSDPPYFNHYTEPFPMYGAYPSIHGSNHIPQYMDSFGPQMLRQAPHHAPGKYPQQPPPVYFPGQYMEPDPNPYKPYPHNYNLHHPSCGCFYCYNKHQQVPGPIPPNAFMTRRFPDIPNEPMLYHRENPVPFVPQVYNPRTANPPLMTSHDSDSHTRLSSDLSTEMGDFFHHVPKREVPLNGRRYCRPLAGGAPFISCCHCFELLRLPKKIILMKKKNQQRIECGACSKIIFLTIDHQKIVTSTPEEMGKTSEEIDDSRNQGVDEHPTRSLDRVKQDSGNFFSDDYDNSGYEFQSMDGKPGSVESVPTDQGLNLRRSDREQKLPSSPLASENEDSPEGFVAPREVENPPEQPRKMILSPPPPGSSLQDYFDYSSNNHAALSCLAEENQSNHSDHEKVICSKVVSRQSSMRDASVATEMEVSFNEFSNTGVSHDSGDVSREEDHLRINKGGDSFLAGIIKKGFRDSSRSTETGDHARNIVMVNGHLIPERLVKKAEKLAGSIHPGEYWYDFYGGFWGVMGRSCLGIIPVRSVISETYPKVHLSFDHSNIEEEMSSFLQPFIEEFKYPMPENCAAGNTGVHVNGRELNQKDLDLLATRGLPTTPGRYYTLEISGKVRDEDSGEELQSLGKLAPSVEKARRGFGMRIPRSAA